MSENPKLRIHVDPLPDDREQAAIAAAVLALSGSAPTEEAAPPADPWQEAGKREALRATEWETIR